MPMHYSEGTEMFKINNKYDLLCVRQFLFLQKNQKAFSFPSPLKMSNQTGLTFFELKEMSGLGVCPSFYN